MRTILLSVALLISAPVYAQVDYHQQWDQYIAENAMAADEVYEERQHAESELRTLEMQQDMQQKLDAQQREIDDLKRLQNY